jgi:hypothetical protein
MIPCDSGRSGRALGLINLRRIQASALWRPCLIETPAFTLPRPLGLPPYHYDLAQYFPHIANNVKQEDKLVFHVVGDTGGVQDGEFQNNVASLMFDQLTSGRGAKPQFCYHVGDVVYFTGMRDDYYAQFYEPYSHYDIPIFSIPGNHDGEVDDPTAQTSLDG